MKRIAYLTSVRYNNIGNAFIDIGAMISISEAIKDKEYYLIQVGQFPIYVESISRVSRLKAVLGPLWRLWGRYLGRSFLEKKYKIIKPGNAFNLASVAKVDYAVFSGCILTPVFFKIFDGLFDKLKEKETKIIFYGCGGDTYSDFEINFVRERLKEIEPYALTTRDSMAFRNYSDLSNNVFDGIDCAFFVNKLPLKGIELDISPYIVLAFDKLENKAIEKELKNKFGHYTIIKTSHEPFPMGRVSVVSNGVSLVSESPYDYLVLYANAEEIYTDRVHACIPALSFGKPCRLYNKTPRARLFEKVCIDGITKKVCYPKNITREQERQLTFLSQILEK